MRVNGLAIREGNKGDGGDNKSRGGEKNGGRGGGGNHNTSGKNDNKKNNANVGNKKWIYTTGMDYNLTCPYKKRQWFKKERNPAEKKLRR